MKVERHGSGFLQGSSVVKMRPVEVLVHQAAGNLEDTRILNFFFQLLPVDHLLKDAELLLLSQQKQLKETQKTFQQRIQQREKDVQQLRETVESHKKQLKEMQKTFQQRIQQREKDVQQLRETVESHKRSAQTAVEDSERIFTELIRSIEKSRSELIRLIRDQEKAAVSRAEGRLERLEQEINDLRRRDAELEQLSHTQDHIQFLQVTEI
ncbi:hypothetical protein Q8A67_021096 [Cirrhinus molitorella]|uniref:TRIM8/14/16/25/29/45/65 coiled-coil region domain-containing protein n=1 Tax=Cirrhinus molitorella TaxID=172907 RepID=A0AA88PKP8_9TELE|nr:hypothetical protein Q8A67_021096 [Cirrhinus molitorella]